MKNQPTVIKVIIIISVWLIGGIALINLNYKKIEPTKAIPDTTTNETVSTNTNILETTNTSKKVLKTTKKIITKKTTKKVKTASYNEYQQYAQQYGNYNQEQMNCLINLWNRESGWNPNSYNKKSGACGIPQALPCSKISKSEGSNDWKAQIRWGIKYVNGRYKTPCNAWDHFKKKGWY